MKNRRISFEQLVSENKRELMEDEESINQLEIRLENKHMMNLDSYLEEDLELFSSER